MTNYIIKNQYVDLFELQVDRRYIEKNFSDNPIVLFKTELNAICASMQSTIETLFPPKNILRGRRSFEPLFMLKVIILQRRLGISEKSMPLEIKTNILIQYALDYDCISSSNVPSSKTIWKYRELFTKNDIFKILFETTVKEGLKLNNNAFKNDDIIIDSSFNIAPRQRNSRETNKLIKEGKLEEIDMSNKHIWSHKDVDATWTKKRNEIFYGYKCHAKCGVQSKLILAIESTTASVHDSQILLPLLSEEDKNKTLYLDAGYVGAPDIAKIQDMNINLVICEKGTRGHPLTEEQIQNNRKKSKIRCRIEHLFGFIEQSMKGFIVRTVGKVRAEANNYLTCATYNIARMLQIKRTQITK